MATPPPPPPDTSPALVALDPSLLDLITDWASALGLELETLDDEMDGFSSAHVLRIPADSPLRTAGPLDGYLNRSLREVEQGRIDRLRDRIRAGRIRADIPDIGRRP